MSIFLFGGADTMNMLVPHPYMSSCAPLYTEYTLQRGPKLALNASEMIQIDASNSSQPCDKVGVDLVHFASTTQFSPDTVCDAKFGVNSRLAALAATYSSGELIFFANIGHLQSKVDRHNFSRETKTQLFR